MRTFIYDKPLKLLQMVKKGIENSILKLIRDIFPRPVSTREISEKLNIAWHTADRYCLKLKILNKIDAFTIGKSTAWYLTDPKDFPKTDSKYSGGNKKK
jgi:hypothetical protein